MSKLTTKRNNQKIIIIKFKAFQKTTKDRVEKANTIYKKKIKWNI